MRIGYSPDKIKTIARPCNKCGGFERYINSKTCPTCSTVKYKKYRKKLAIRFRDQDRITKAIKGGYVAPPSENDCPSRPLDGHCELCHKHAHILCLDHCHKTGKFRGWLCLSCNQLLGKIERIGLDYVLMALKPRDAKSGEIHRDWLILGTEPYRIGLGGK